MCLGLDGDGEDAVRAAGKLVAACCGYVAIGGANPQHLKRLCGGGDRLFGKVLDVDAALDVLADAEVERGGVEQVHDLLLVDLEERAATLEAH